VALVETDVSEERIASGIRVKIGFAIRLRRRRQMEAMLSSQTSALARTTRRHIPEDGILHSHRRENLKSYLLSQYYL
jgi:hypothetical protein